MTQEAMILSDLKKGKRITPVNALNKYGCFRLAARIFDLRNQGHKIGRTIAPAGYAVYFWEGKA